MTTKRPAKRASSTSTAKTATPRPRAAATKTRGRRKPFVTAPPGNCFWVHYGPILKDLRELRDALATQISDAQFAHHVEGDRNDFANWVDHVLAEKTCARALRKAKSVAEALRAVEATLAK